MTRLITPQIKRVRERARADGSTHIWWEAEKTVQELGFTNVALDEHRLTWSRRQAEDLNRSVERALDIGKHVPPRRRGRTVQDLIENYRHSRKFRAIRPKTRRSYSDFFNAIERKWGGYPVSHFTKPVMNQWYETLLVNNGRYQAKALITHFSILFAHGERIGWRAEGSNPCSRLDLEIPQPRSRTLSWSEIDMLVSAADHLGWIATGTGILLSALQGQRQTDVLNARPEDFQLRKVIHPITGEPETVWVWSLVRSKRGNEGIMQLHPDLVERLCGTIARLPKGAEFLLLDEIVGRPYADVPDLFRKRFAKVRALAAETLPDIKTAQYRDLRRTFGVLARTGGASKDDTGDVLGNSAATNPRLGETYMPPQFFTSSRAVLAIKRPEDPERKKA